MIYTILSFLSLKVDTTKNNIYFVLFRIKEVNKYFVLSLVLPKSHKLICVEDI